MSVPRSLTISCACSFPSRAIAHVLPPLVVAAALVAACGQAQQGGFHGFPPARGDDDGHAAADAARDLRVRRPDRGLEGSRGARARRRASSRSVSSPKAPGEGRASRCSSSIRSRCRRRPPPPRPRSRACAHRSRKPSAKLARLKPLAEKRAVGQKEADDAASNADLARAALKAAEAQSCRGEPQSRLHARQRADHRPVEPLHQVRRQSRHRERHAAHADLAGRPDLGAVQRVRERPARARARRRRGQAHAAEGQRVRRHDQAVRRLDVSAQGQNQLQRHARQSDDRARTRCAPRSPTPTAR